MRRPPFLAFLPLAAFAACSTTPAAKSPLKEALASQTQHQIEQSVMACLTQAGYQVDPFPENVGGMRRVRAVRKGDTTELYIQPQGMTPRIQGGPDSGDKETFWPCLEHPPNPADEGSEPSEPSSSPSAKPIEKDDVPPANNGK